MSFFHPDDYTVDNDSESYLTRVVVDTNSRLFYLYSNDGDKRTVKCETVEQFMSVLELVRSVVSDDIVAYCEPSTY